MDGRTDLRSSTRGGVLVIAVTTFMFGLAMWCVYSDQWLTAAVFGFLTFISFSFWNKGN